VIKRFTLTSILVLTALAAIFWKYQNYLENPWTRDGQVRAQIIQITPRVTGPIVSLHVQDNSQVKTGDILFKIDPRTYQVALNKAKANLAQAKVALNNAKDEAQRRQALAHRDPGSVSTSMLIKLNNEKEAAKAGVMVARAAVALLELDLSFTEVKAPADGFITNLNLRVGSQVVANQPALALVDLHRGFFKETDISDVSPAAQAVVTLMSYPDQPLQGKVESVGYGIARQDGATGSKLLPSVNPTFQWIRLAQRIPVTIKLKKIPDNVHFRVGTSASIMIIKNSQQTQ